MKLHASFKSSLPRPLFEHLEARGCVFQWRDKEFQVCLFTGHEVHKETNYFNHVWTVFIEMLATYCNSFVFLKRQQF